MTSTPTVIQTGLHEGSYLSSLYHQIDPGSKSKIIEPGMGPSQLGQLESESYGGIPTGQHPVLRSSPFHHTPRNTITAGRLLMKNPKNLNHGPFVSTHSGNHNIDFKRDLASNFSHYTHPHSTYNDGSRHAAPNQSEIEKIKTDVEQLVQLGLRKYGAAGDNEKQKSMALDYIKVAGSLVKKLSPSEVKSIRILNAIPTPILNILTDHGLTKFSRADPFLHPFIYGNPDFIIKKDLSFFAGEREEEIKLEDSAEFHVGDGFGHASAPEHYQPLDDGEGSEMSWDWVEDHRDDDDGDGRGGGSSAVLSGIIYRTSTGVEVDGGRIERDEGTTIYPVEAPPARVRLPTESKLLMETKDEVSDLAKAYRKRSMPDPAPTEATHDSSRVNERGDAIPAAVKASDFSSVPISKTPALQSGLTRESVEKINKGIDPAAEGSMIAEGTPGVPRVSQSTGDAQQKMALELNGYKIEMDRIAQEEGKLRNEMTGMHTKGEIRDIVIKRMHLWQSYIREVDNVILLLKNNNMDTTLYEQEKNEAARNIVELEVSNIGFDVSELYEDKTVPILSGEDIAYVEKYKEMDDETLSSALKASLLSFGYDLRNAEKQEQYRKLRLAFHARTKYKRIQEMISQENLKKLEEVKIAEAEREVKAAESEERRKYWEGMVVQLKAFRMKNQVGRDTIEEFASQSAKKKKKLGTVEDQKEAEGLAVAVLELHKAIYKIDSEMIIPGSMEEAKGAADAMSEISYSSDASDLVSPLDLSSPMDYAYEETTKAIGKTSVAMEAYDAFSSGKPSSRPYVGDYLPTSSFEFPSGGDFVSESGRVYDSDGYEIYMKNGEYIKSKESSYESFGDISPVGKEVEEVKVFDMDPPIQTAAETLHPIIAPWDEGKDENPVSSDLVRAYRETDWSEYHYDAEGNYVKRKEANMELDLKEGDIY